MRIENWSVVAGSTGDPYQAPETNPCLHGLVYEHREFADGSEVTTSRLTGSNIVEGYILTATGSLYCLGEVDPAYEAVYPNARARLFFALARDGTQLI